TLLLWVLLLLLAVTALAMRNAFGVLAVCVTAVGVSAVTWAGSASAQALFGYGAAWFLLFGGARPVVELARSRSRRWAARAGGAARRHRRGIGWPGLRGCGGGGGLGFSGGSRGRPWCWGRGCSPPARRPCRTCRSSAEPGTSGGVGPDAGLVEAGEHLGRVGV